MDAYYETLDKIGDAIIEWSDPGGKFRADREVSALVMLLDISRRGMAPFKGRVVHMYFSERNSD